MTAYSGTLSIATMDISQASARASMGYAGSGAKSHFIKTKLGKKLLGTNSKKKDKNGEDVNDGLDDVLRSILSADWGYLQKHLKTKEGKIEFKDALNIIGYDHSLRKNQSQLSYASGGGDGASDILYRSNSPEPSSCSNLIDSVPNSSRRSSMDFIKKNNKSTKDTNIDSLIMSPSSPSQHDAASSSGCGDSHTVNSEGQSIGSKGKKDGSNTKKTSSNKDDSSNKGNNNKQHPLHSRSTPTLLHLVCTLNPPIQLVEKIVWDKPEMINVLNSNHQTPLHLAAAYGACPEVITCLLCQNPLNLASMRDYYLKTPLHYTCECGPSMYCQYKEYDNDESEFLLDVVESLGKYYPEAVNLQDCNNMTPLDYAIKNDADEAVINALQTLAQKAI